MVNYHIMKSVYEFEICIVERSEVVTVVECSGLKISMDISRRPYILHTKYQTNSNRTYIRNKFSIDK